MRRPRGVDLSTAVGSVRLPNPVMTAAGTAGHGDELADYFDLSSIGAVVVKSLSVDRWAGNPAPRVADVTGGMINAVGLQNPGVADWIAAELPLLRARGARVVASVWGSTVDEFGAAAAALASRADELTAIEVNVSCPNLEAGSQMFAHDPEATAAAVAACGVAGVPLWAKLSPNTDRLVAVAGAAAAAGAEAVTLINTVVGLRLDARTGRPVLGHGTGGVSGPAIRPVAVRAIWEVRAAHPNLPIVGVGGIANSDHAMEHVFAGASAVQVGTAIFADPRAPRRVLTGMRRSLRRAGVRSVGDAVGAGHVRGSAR